MLVPQSYLPTLLAWDYSFCPFEGSLSDPAETTPPTESIKIVNHEFNTRVLILVDMDQMEP